MRNLGKIGEIEMVKTTKIENKTGETPDLGGGKERKNPREDSREIKKDLNSLPSPTV